jgi:hypothetical protein
MDDSSLQSNESGENRNAIKNIGKFSDIYRFLSY